jgi:Ni,Fe-hydrogenase III large subunit
MIAGLPAITNGRALSLERVPRLDLRSFQETLAFAMRRGMRVSALFGRAGEGAQIEVFAIIADDQEGRLRPARTAVPGVYPSMAGEFPQVHLFEREMAEELGLPVRGHPWLRPVRFPPGRPAPSGRDPGPLAPVGVMDFYQVKGEQVHEVAVGPVHAGVIEPGHFRFQCHGEEVFNLEISLGYQHRGVERALVGGPDCRSIHYAETLAGDTSVGHATAYCQALEGLAGCRVPPRADVIRGVALELERLANHAGDLGALAGDVAYLPTASYCGRLRGDFLNMTGLLCGSRFGRGLVRPGGVGFDLDPDRGARLLERLDAAMRDMTGALGLLWETPSVTGRFEDTGKLAPRVCAELGLVGPAARACGLDRDVRHAFPAGIFHFAHIPVSTWPTGDVFARAYVRWLEIQQSAQFVREQAGALPPGAIRAAAGALAAGHIVVSLVEGWRGEICHVAITDGRGRLARYKVVDPSFHNWSGLAVALRGQQISDFPLCNKSFNLSYCGHDL